MAVHSISTPVPAPQRGLLRAFAHSRALVPNHREISGSCPPAAPLADPESTADQPSNASGLAPDEALASTALVGLLEPALPSLTSAELDDLLAVRGRPTHRFRALVAAAAHGAALLDALDLPPLALDVLDVAIAALDYRDGDPDLEDDDPAEETSLETAGRGFVRCGADDAEDESSDEDDELGDEHAPEHVKWIFGPKRNAEAERQHFAAWLAAAEVAHACG